MYDKVSLVLLLIHWIDCSSGEKITVQSIMEDYDKGYHNVGFGVGVTINEQEVHEILTSLTNFEHLTRYEDGVYVVEPLGGILKNVDSTSTQYLREIDFGKQPLAGVRNRKFVYIPPPNSEIQK